MSAVGKIIGSVVGFIMKSISSILIGLFKSVFSVMSLGKSDKDGLQRPEASDGIMTNTRDPQTYIPLIYGQRRVGLNQVFVATSGTDNNYLHIIGVIGEGEIDSIVNVADEGKSYNGLPCIWLDDKHYSEYGGNVTYTFYNGSSTQNVDANLSAACPQWNDALRNTAYLYIKLYYNENYFSNLPDITVEVKGLKVYDTRTSTTAYSNNPALVAYDYLTRKSIRGGMEIDSSRVISSSVDDVANWCDTKGWKCDLVINENKTIVDNLIEIIRTFHGDIIYSLNKFKLVYRDTGSESAVMTLDKGDVVESGGISSLTIKQPSIWDTPNQISVKYPNRSNKYITDDYILTDTTAVTSNGDVREETLDLAGVAESTNAMKLAAYYLERKRVNKTVDFNAHSRCMPLEPHDLVTLTHDMPGWDSKLLRVQSVSIIPDGAVQISAIEESSIFYDYTYNFGSYTYHDTTLAGPLDTIPNVTGVSLAEETYYWADRTHTRLLVNFNPPPSTSYPWWDHAEVYVSLDGNNYKSIGNSQGDFQIDPVEEGEVYYIKLRSVNIWGGKEDLSMCYVGNKLIDGKTTEPTTPQPITASASGDVILIMTDLITDPDIIGYEVRLGSAWAGGVYFGIYKGTQIRLAGIKPGSYTLWMAPKDNRGRYSSTKLSGAVTVFYPSNYANQATWLWDFGTQGVFSNTEATQEGGATVIKCKHDNSNQLLNPSYASGIADWSTSNVVCTTLATGGVGDLECVKVECTGAATGLIYQDTTKMFRNFRNNFVFHYRGASGSSDGKMSYGVYDITNSADLIAETTLAHTTVWSSVSTYFDIGWGTTGVRVSLQITSSGKQAYYDDVSLKNSSYLEGKWQSPEYDLGDKKYERVWGDFITVFVNSSGKWAALPSTYTWADILSSSKRWYQLNEITAAAQLQATFRAGDASDTYHSTVGFFQISAPEVYARYYRVELSITDPDNNSNLMLQNLNMIAAYWTTLNT